MNNERILKEIENSLIRELHKDNLFKISHNDKISIDKEIKEIYKKIDFNNVMRLVINKIEENIAEKIVNHFATEIGTDIKSLYANKSIREDIRFAMRKNIELVLDKIKEV